MNNKEKYRKNMRYLDKWLSNREKDKRIAAIHYIPDSSGWHLRVRYAEKVSCQETDRVEFLNRLGDGRAIIRRCYLQWIGKDG